MWGSQEFPGWEAGESGNLIITVTVAEEKIRLATAIRAGELFET